MLKKIMCLSLMLLFAVFFSYTQIHDNLSLVSLKTGVINGISMDKRTLLILDSKSNEIIRYDYTKKVVVEKLKLEVKNPSGIIYDGKNFWTIDRKENSIKQLDKKTGKVLNTLKPDLKDESAQLESFTSDGKNLWISYFAGWSSSIAKIDPRTGKVLMSFFSGCYPKHITYNNKYIWVVCYNKGIKPCTISRFTISNNVKKMRLSNIFLSKTEVLEPLGIVTDNKNLFIVDKKTKIFHQIKTR